MSTPPDPSADPVALDEPSASEAPRSGGTRELVAALDRIDLAAHGGEEFFEPVGHDEAEELAAASTVTLGPPAVDHGFEAGLLARGPSRAELEALARSPSLSLERLPGWPEAGECGQGLGPTIAGWLAPIRPGSVLVLEATSHELRRSFLAQLADGLSMRDSPEEPLTPVIRLSEESALHQRARLLGRMLGRSPRAILASSHEHEQGTAIDRAWQACEQLQRSGRPYLWSDPQVRARLSSTIERWRRALIERERGARSIWPVLIVDELAALEGRVEVHVRELAETAEQHGLIVLLGGDQRGELVELDRFVDARLVLRGESEAELLVTLAHARLAAPARSSLRWEAAAGRFEWRSQP